MARKIRKPKGLSKIPSIRRTQLAEAGDFRGLLREMAGTQVSEAHIKYEFQRLHDVLEQRMQDDPDHCIDEMLQQMLVFRGNLLLRAQLATAKSLDQLTGFRTIDEAANLTDFAERHLPLLERLEVQFIEIMMARGSRHRILELTREKQLQNAATQKGQRPIRKKRQDTMVPADIPECQPSAAPNHTPRNRLVGLFDPLHPAGV